jgi:hypothetical protein
MAVHIDHAIAEKRAALLSYARGLTRIYAAEWWCSSVAKGRLDCSRAPAES